MAILEEILSSNARAEVFRLLFKDTCPELYLREMQRLSSVSLTPIKIELEKLVGLDLVIMRKDGNRTYYKAHESHPIYNEIKELVNKTSGYIFKLKERLNDERIKFAFIYGSVAKGEEKAQSDIDLFVIGNIGLRDITKLISGIQEEVEREINPNVYKLDKFIREYEKGNNFIRTVVKESKIFLRGSESEFEGLI